jgi:type 1 fimbria pilin
MRFTKLLLAVVLTGISGLSHAALECKFDSNNTLQIMSPGVTPSIVPLPVGTVGSTPVQISSTIIMETTPALKSHCAVGNDGENVYQMTNNAMLISSIDNKAAFRTNVPGIEYTVAFYPDGNALTAWFPLNAGSWYMTGDAHDNEDALDGKTWHVRVDIYQTNGFAGIPDNVNYLSIGSGPIGQIILGNPSGTTTEDHPRPLVNLSEMSFNVPLDRPTCALRMPYTVNLGDWTPAEVENGTTTVVPVNVTGTCTNTHNVSYTMSSANTTDDKKYFTNSLESNASVTAAGGVGVKITFGPNDAFPVPAGYKQILHSDYLNPVNIINDNIWAHLVKTGSEPVTPGAFGANITFQFTYE